MWRVVFVIVGAAACYRPAIEASCTVSCTAASGCPAGLECVDGLCGPSTGCEIDGVPDAAPGDVASPNAICVGDAQGLFPGRCFDGPFDDGVSFVGTTTLDTSTDARCFEPAPVANVCFVLGGFITIEAGAVLRVTGSRALVLWSATTIVVDGTIDVSSHTTGAFIGKGAAASDSTCPAINGNAGTGGSGGAGGSLGAQGGDGGTAPNAMAGKAVFVAGRPTTLRGGCRGGTGGRVGGAPGGDSGGAVYLMAKDSITLAAATITASGAGAGFPAADAGGGGGGSGGLIGFDAPSLIFGSGARVVALGGGASSGGGDTTTGKVGLDATLTGGGFSGAATVAANRGGIGSAGPQGQGENGGNVAGTVGGGGGGGGADGVIMLFPPIPVGGTLLPRPI